jgi:hypothetical protein
LGLYDTGLSCVTRSRRFGKSMAAKMLAAYFSPPSWNAFK